MSESGEQREDGVEPAIGLRSAGMRPDPDFAARTRRRLASRSAPDEGDRDRARPRAIALACAGTALYALALAGLAGVGPLAAG